MYKSYELSYTMYLEKAGPEIRMFSWNYKIANFSTRTIREKIAHQYLNLFKF